MPAAGLVLVFISSAAVIVGMLPAPLRPVDYFLAGAVATLVASLAVFLGYVRVSRVGDVFFKRRHKAGDSRPRGRSGTLDI